MALRGNSEPTGGKLNLSGRHRRISLRCSRGEMLGWMKGLSQGWRSGSEKGPAGMEGSPCSPRGQEVPGEGSGALLRAEPPGPRGSAGAEPGRGPQQEWGWDCRGNGIGNAHQRDSGLQCGWTQVCSPGGSGIAAGMGLGLQPRLIWGYSLNGSKTATQVGAGFQQEWFWDCSPNGSGIAMQMDSGLLPCWV